MGLGLVGVWSCGQAENRIKLNMAMRKPRGQKLGELETSLDCKGDHRSLDLRDHALCSPTSLSPSPDCLQLLDTSA